MCVSSSPHQIQERLEDLKKEGASLQELWEEQKQRFDELLEYQLFMKEAESIQDMSSAHEVRGVRGGEGMTCGVIQRYMCDVDDDDELCTCTCRTVYKCTCKLRDG